MWRKSCLVSFPWLSFRNQDSTWKHLMLLWLVTSSEWEIHQGGFRRKNHNEQRALVYECVKKWRNWKRSNWGYPNTIDSAAKVINFPISFLTIWVILISTSTTRCGCCSKKYVEKTRLYKTTTIFRKKTTWKKTGWWFFNHPSQKYATLKLGSIFPK